MIHKLYYAACDVCLEIDSGTFDSAKDARREAAKVGWKLRAGRDFCPRCWVVGEPPNPTHEAAQTEETRGDGMSEDALVESVEHGWPGYCQACGAALNPPNAISCRSCGRSDTDE